MSHLTLTPEAYEANQRKRGKLKESVRAQPSTEGHREASTRTPDNRNRSKYKNEPTWVDGLRFDSKREAKRWQDLELRRKAGAIACIERQKRYSLGFNGEHICDYIADFVYREHGIATVVEDCKGFRTQVYKLKKKLMKAIYGIDILET